MNQIELHSKIDNLIAKGIKSVKVDYASGLINTNDDAKQYFYSKADERWLEWLWENGFLKNIKQKAADQNSYGFRMPELNYLFRMVGKKPKKVSEIICSFKITSNNFNPEVIDQFTRISSKLPAKHLGDIVRKIRDEKWLKLMGSYTQYGFEYADMLEKLQNARDVESILALSEAILLVRYKKELKKKKYSYRSDDVFYIHDLTETKVFNYLVDMPTKYQEGALSVAVSSFNKVVKNNGDYQLLDVDFFSLSLGEVASDSYKETLKFLVATIIELTRKIFKDKDKNHNNLYEKYFESLPDNRPARRLKLFVLSLDSELFIDKLKFEYFRLFETKNIYNILYGAEYERALKAGFPFLNEKDKRKYITKVIKLFSGYKDNEEKRWKQHYGSCILSTISKNLLKKEKALAKLKGFKIDPKYEPEPTIGKMAGGTVTPRSPLSEEDFSSLSVEDIVKKLKSELSPEALREKYSRDDFLNPRDADGVVAQLKNDIKGRIGEYLDKAALFFDRNKLIPHYTNAYLRGVKDSLYEDRSNLVNLNYDELFKLLQEIKKSGEKKPFGKTDKDPEGRWLSDWNSVHSTIADLIEELIKQKDKKTMLNFKTHRKQVLEILRYLLKYNDPIPEDEKLKTAKSTIKRPGESEYSISDPFAIAINSVKGRTFQTFLHFIYQDASNSKNIKLADDVKTLYDQFLKKENTRAIMFMFGHYLPSFHFRDMKWTRSKFDEIFESKKKDKYLHLAVWEGYLSNNLYRELFFEPYFQKLYSKNITLKLKYPKQKFFKDPHESIAIHFALAFIHYEEFEFNNKLFREFLKKASTKQLSEFISFIGRSFIAGENNVVLKDKSYPWRIERVKDFWALMLKKKVESSVLEKFGTWIEVSKNIFDAEWLADKISQTLAITNGVLEWEYGLEKSIEELAENFPEKTLNILEKHFLSLINNERGSFPIRADKEWHSAFKILYNSKDEGIRDKTYNLISKLMEKGGRQFWNLEDIVKKYSS